MTQHTFIAVLSAGAAPLEADLVSKSSSRQLLSNFYYHGYHNYHDSASASAAASASGGDASAAASAASSGIAFTELLCIGCITAIS